MTSHRAAAVLALFLFSCARAPRLLGSGDAQAMSPADGAEDVGESSDGSSGGGAETSPVDGSDSRDGPSGDVVESSPKDGGFDGGGSDDGPVTDACVFVSADGGYVCFAGSLACGGTPDCDASIHYGSNEFCPRPYQIEGTCPCGNYTVSVGFSPVAPCQSGCSCQIGDVGGTCCDLQGSTSKGCCLP
jgi:hypothetical protein